MHCQSKLVVRLPQSAFVLLSHAATVNSLMNMASMFECIMEGYKLTAVTSTYPQAANPLLLHGAMRHGTMRQT